MDALKITTVSRFGVCALMCALLLSAACGGGARAVRGDDEPGLDHHAMSTGLDRRDLQKMLNENMETMRHSAVVQRWLAEDRPPVAVMPIRNETSEHIDSSLQALISDVETKLIEWGAVRVISLENQQALLQEIRKQSGAGFDQAQVAAFGRQVGAKYLITGKVYTTDERVGDQRRVQYYMFLQVIGVETGEVFFQNKNSITKAIIRD